MAEKSLKKDHILCLASLAIILASYGVERVIEVFAPVGKDMALIMAMIFTLALAVVYFLVAKTQDTFFGLMAALIGYKMMPPSISVLSNCADSASALYYVVQKAGIVIFVLLIVKFYKQQNDKGKIHAVPILSAMFVVPFTQEIASSLGKYFMSTFGGSMLYLYFTQYAFYGIAMLVILSVAWKSNANSMTFITIYECLALAINILRKGSAVALLLSKGEHVSGSYYAWILLFGASIVLFLVADKIKQKKMNA